MPESTPPPLKQPPRLNAARLNDARHPLRATAAPLTRLRNRIMRPLAVTLIGAHTAGARKAHAPREIAGAERERLARQLRESRETHLVIDCSDTEYVDASALGTLLVVDSECRRSGRMLVLCCEQPGPMGVLRMTHVGARLHIAADEDEARHMLHRARLRAANDRAEQKASNNSLMADATHHLATPYDGTTFASV